MSDEQIFDNLINVLQKYNFAECSCYDSEIYKGLFRIINEKWITIHPHGDVVDEDGKKDYRRLKLEDGESPREAIERVFKKKDKKQKIKKVKRNFSDIAEDDVPQQKKYFSDLDYSNLNLDELREERENFRKLKLNNMEYSDRVFFQNIRMKLDNGIRRGEIKIEADKVGGYTKKLNDIWGFTHMPDIAWMSDDMQKLVCKKSKQIKDKYPKLNLRAFEGYTLGKSTYAQYTSSLRQVTLNKRKYSDANELKKTYENDVKKNFHPKGTNYESALTHEIGHALHYYIEKKYGIAPKTIRKNVLDRLKLKQKEVGKHLSYYAMAKPRSAHEFFAEAFAEGFDSKNPRPLAVEFMKEINKILEGAA